MPTHGFEVNQDVREVIAQCACGTVRDVCAIRLVSRDFRHAVDTAVRWLVVADQPELASTLSAAAPCERPELRLCCDVEADPGLDTARLALTTDTAGSVHRLIAVVFALDGAKDSLREGDICGPRPVTVMARNSVILESGASGGLAANPFGGVAANDTSPLRQAVDACLRVVTVGSVFGEQERRLAAAVSRHSIVRTLSFVVQAQSEDASLSLLSAACASIETLWIDFQDPPTLDGWAQAISSCSRLETVDLSIRSANLLPGSRETDVWRALQRTGVRTLHVSGSDRLTHAVFTLAPHCRELRECVFRRDVDLGAGMKLNDSGHLPSASGVRRGGRFGAPGGRAAVVATVGGRPVVEDAARGTLRWTSSPQVFAGDAVLTLHASSDTATPSPALLARRAEIVFDQQWFDEMADRTDGYECPATVKEVSVTCPMMILSDAPSRYVSRALSDAIGSLRVFKVNGHLAKYDFLERAAATLQHLAVDVRDLPSPADIAGVLSRLTQLRTLECGSLVDVSSIAGGRHLQLRRLSVGGLGPVPFARLAHACPRLHCLSVRFDAHAEEDPLVGWDRRPAPGATNGVQWIRRSFVAAAPQFPALFDCRGDDDEVDVSEMGIVNLWCS
uniref:Uncharacterized protein n=1 Tax=Neobodo designis TaxID=312471 RepID=A0A7S1Q8A3_NEODS|mmetsp:Transcript_34069/g.105227  ORF Transcript_34069/g.105227 Transcript_34069/m.105227 type:complete len:619 (+) Transcript_34069:53-1909(+)|eukprot:CAMPEP_0174839882 /NCGR_PEP_ID=MMETSP1114-20130205/8330_1 /TAXON_ID=312471 /ORGANISM="Neobodo designis, Strain CCAP 1951/1" /LENGTH=618 /DNA_ID=CAMNT_0016074011 /DNA_START=52 /DNA_END=1905 /DNA_ORIENTATION=+